MKTFIFVSKVSLIFCVPLSQFFPKACPATHWISEDKFSTTKIKNFTFKVCKECAKRFRGRPDLVQHHLGSHLNEKPFACHLCNYTTSYLKYIDKHLLAHSRFVLFNNQHKLLYVIYSKAYLSI